MFVCLTRLKRAGRGEQHFDEAREDNKDCIPYVYYYNGLRDAMRPNVIKEILCTAPPSDAVAAGSGC